MESRFAATVVGAFLIGACAIAVAAVFSKDRRKLGVLYVLEIAQVGCVLVPAALGAPAFDIFVVALVLVCGRELYRCLSAARAPWGMIGVGFLLLGAGAWSMWRVGASSFPLLALGYSLVEINDTGAWAVGSAVGKHKLWPAVSPKKTWEGLFGGVAACLVLAWLFRFLVPDWSMTRVLGGALLMAASGTTGDLLASAAKRRAGLGTYADWIPYQGGVLDLYDSFLFASVPWLLYALAVGALP